MMTATNRASTREEHNLSVKLKHGDCTGLAGDYAKFRPGYAPQVATAIAADIAGCTGIWTRILAANGCAQ